MINDLMRKVDDLRKEVGKQKPESVVIVMDSNLELGDRVVAHLAGNLKKINTKIMRFGNNEINTFPEESVREKYVYIIGSGSNINGTINDNIMAMCSMIRACRDASAKYVTLLCPYFPYARSDKKDMARGPIMGKLMTDLFKIAGTDRLIAVDLHAGQIQGFFSGPFDNLYSIDVLIEAVKRDIDLKNVVLVSPDAGGEKRTANWSHKTGCPYTFMTKTRDHTRVSVIAKQELVDKDIDLNGKDIIQIDDMGDSLGTLIGSAKILKGKGARRVIAVVTHGVLSGKAFENLAENDIDVIYVTNSLPQEANIAKSPKIKVVDISKLLADAILSCVNGTSMSSLFK